MARKVEYVGIQKAEVDSIRTLFLVILEVSLIYIDAVFATTISMGAGELAFG